MATRPQNSPRINIIAKDILADTELSLNTLDITQDSTSKGLVFDEGASALPTHDAGIAFCFVSDSTGVSFAWNSTGTTWVYATATSVRADAI